MNYNFKIKQGEYWWGGLTCDTLDSPYSDKSTYELDLEVRAGNQSSPFFLSSMGRYIWSEHPFKIRFENGEILIDGKDVILVEAGTTLKEAYLDAMNKYFPSDKKELPDVPPNVFISELAHDFMKKHILISMLALYNTMKDSQICIFKTDDSSFITSSSTFFNKNFTNVLAIL